ncbi:MAG: hypothetical protein WA906_03205 [Pacificimonas sp.]
MRPLIALGVALFIASCAEEPEAVVTIDPEPPLGNGGSAAEVITRDVAAGRIFERPTECNDFEVVDEASAIIGDQFADFMTAFRRRLGQLGTTIVLHDLVAEQPGRRVIRSRAAGKGGEVRVVWLRDIETDCLKRLTFARPT